MQPDLELRAKLLDTAQRVAAEHGWPWQEPIEVKSAAFQGEGVWEVVTNRMVRGAGVRVLIRRTDGEVVHSGFLSR
jgi:hypothetical protein